MIAPLLLTSRYARARWLVLAPHADDETLGAGALISETAAADRLAGLVYLTDGAASHRAGGPWLARVREREARLAARRLGYSGRPEFLKWADAHPHDPESAAWRSTVRRLAMLIRTLRIDAVAVTGAQEPHCDHAAFHALATAAIYSACRSVALFEYRVWSDPALAAARRTFRTRAMSSGIRRHALMAHRSQTSAVYGKGFRLAPAARRMPAFDVLHLNEVRHVVRE
ncbi:PIG-L deacetylase family protein [Sphingomonas radiodurans]|uniref:PIG-L deacetylase family protein n=1 Tax=Sphingomonas radiodurans TaxID=2890321 RepID=UPI001E52A09E|nr:PIG-L family deacetylase [Sphingomonas radiodurans]WBH15835.1 PIG-L family deacetylase [Sphingomonas radiodurans]